MAWVKNLLTGALWEVSQEKADELTRWYPKEYQLVNAPAANEAGVGAEASHTPATALPAPKAKNKNKE